MSGACMLTFYCLHTDFFTDLTITYKAVFVIATFS